jgi:NAD(P)-dependent dehydrogenase (short-subunit alcohol dehydrogenase family)
MVNRLENQTVVILGGSSGIGYAVAKNILESTKAKVVVGSSNAKKVEQAVASLEKIDGIKGRITGYAVNLDTSVSDESIAQFYNKIGEFNHLIYTAADPLNMIPVEEISKAKGDKAFGIRYWSLLASVRLALAHMPKSADSSIVVTAGTVVFHPMKGWGAGIVGVGCAVEGLTRGLAVDLAPIRVNCIAPNAIPETDVWSGVSKEAMAEMVEDLKKKMLTGRIGRADDIAEGYAYLLKARHTTGQTLVLDGGELLS